jgi:hypothetical protein
MVRFGSLRAFLTEAFKAFENHILALRHLAQLLLPSEQEMGDDGWDDGWDVVSEWSYFPYRRCISSFAKSPTDPLQPTFPSARP